jgi:hypothetical protein
MSIREMTTIKTVDTPRIPLPSQRVRAALRDAAPALLGYAAVRAVGVVVLIYWGHARGQSWLRKLSTIWDANWYANVAVHGYGHSLPAMSNGHGPAVHSNMAFFPLYPAAIRVVRAITPFDTHYSALAIAWVASLAAAWGIFAVGSWCYGRQVGIAATLLWGVLPQAVIESLAYTEPLFTALAAWSLYAVLTRRWLWAGVLCALAGLTRPSGAAVLAAVGFAVGAELLRLRRLGQPAKAWRPCLGLLIGAAGLFGYVGWVDLRLGRWDGYLAVQHQWNSNFDFGHSTARHIAALLLHSTPSPLGGIVVTLILCAAAVLFALSSANRQPLPLLVYSAMLMVMAVGDTGFFNSRSRFLLPAFPLLLPLATGLTRVRSRASRVVLLSSATIASALYGGFLVYVYNHAL